jgi:hypothetical protein
VVNTLGWVEGQGYDLLLGAVRALRVRFGESGKALRCGCQRGGGGGQRAGRKTAG